VYELRKFASARFFCSSPTVIEISAMAGFHLMQKFVDAVGHGFSYPVGKDFPDGTVEPYNSAPNSNCTMIDCRFGER